MANDDILRMTGGDLDIQLDSVNAISYIATTTEYDKALANKAFSWHMIIVHHKGHYKKSQIVNAFFDLVRGNEFYPIGYREYKQDDRFLVRNCPVAIQRLFAAKLQLPVTHGKVIPLTVKLKIGEYNMRQISVTHKIEKVLQKQLQALEIVGSCANVLNLGAFSNHSELGEIIINLGNKSAFQLFCKVIQQKHRTLSHVNGLKLNSNNINNLLPIEALSRLNLQMVDLRFNNIKEIGNFKFLKCFKIIELHISGNPFAEKPGYVDQIKEMLPSLTKLDGISTRKRPGNQSGVRDADMVEITSNGDIITSENPIPLYTFKKYKNSSKWHQIVVHHKGIYNKAEIIDALFATFPIQKTDFYPCYYKNGRHEDTFLVRNNFEHLEIFLSNSLIIGIPNSEDSIVLTLKMNVADFSSGQVDPVQLISTAIENRFSVVDRILDLESFSSSVAFKHLTISLENAKTLNTVLIQCARRYHSMIVELRLANNDIVSSKGMQSLILMKNLKVVDLSNNRIEDLTDLETMPKSTVINLKLDGNPLCGKCPIANIYTKAVKKLFPELSKLDGVDITNENTIAIQKNFLCSIEAYDFVEHFITSYFTTYDSLSREKLIGMYDENAMFSMSTLYDTRKMKSLSKQNKARIQSYADTSRNICTIRNYNYSLVHNTSLCGKNNIKLMLDILPKTEHDFLSFTTDTTIFTRQLVCITISGVFHDCPTNLNDDTLLLAFTRTFLLHSTACGLGIFKNQTEYKIINEQLHVQSVTSFQDKSAFKISKPVKPPNKPLLPEDKEAFMVIFQQMTGLKPIWCKRCFDDAEWDFAKALEVFVNLTKNDTIRMGGGCGDLDIQLDHFKAIPYFGTTEYDKALASTAYSWHMIVVHHKGKYNKLQIMNALFELVQGCEFYPVAYREYKEHDKFLVRHCPAAIQCLFDVKLQLPMFRGQVIPITFKLNIGEYHIRQVTPTTKLEKIFVKQLQALEIVGSCASVLNLGGLANHPELKEIIINFGNKPAFELLCKIVQQKQKCLSNINGLKLNSNNISNLAPIEALSKLNLQMVDLRYNNIKETENLKFLKCFNIIELHISGNPFTEKSGYVDEVKEILPNLTKLDGISTRKRPGNQPAVREADIVEIISNGDVITPEDPIALYAFKKYKNSPMWHQVVVHHRNVHSKTVIMDALYATFANQKNEFYPCYYKVGRNEDTFMVRNNFDHLESFLSNSLIISIPNSEDTILLTLKMNVATFNPGQVDPVELISNAIGDRFSVVDRILNLENFSSSAALKYLTISLGSTKTLNTVLIQCARRYHSMIVELRLANNDIISAKGMQSLSLMKSLKIVDLSNNRIEDLTDLAALPKSTVKEIRLDGNPLCGKCPIANVYIKEVKKLFPELTKLDGVTITNENTITTQKNFLCSIEAYDFVEQFVSTYFNIYDSPSRKKLIDMYDQNAMFSMSFLYDTNKINKLNSVRIQNYADKSRNIIGNSNYSRIHLTALCGKSNISLMLDALANTEHDFLSFSMDATLFTRQLVCITISGVFRDCPDSILEDYLPFAFTRTFLLRSTASGLGIFKNQTEYKIVNEQLHVQSITSYQDKTAFRMSKPINPPKEPLLSEDKEAFMVIFQQLTGLKPIWCTRCFEDAQWDFPKALEVFVNLTKNSGIPPTAYIEGHTIG